MEDFLRENDCEKVNIDGIIDILLLLDADDLVIFASIASDLQRKIHLLKLFCEKLLLQVNIEKTKILICRRGGKSPGNLHFFYGTNELEVTNSFEYLGPKISPAEFSRTTTLAAINKVKSAFNSVHTLLIRSKTDSIECISKLFDIIIAAILLYASPIWAIKYLDLIEQVQTDFFKRIFCQPRSTAGALLRVELDNHPLA